VFDLGNVFEAITCKNHLTAAIHRIKDIDCGCIPRSKIEIISMEKRPTRRMYDLEMWFNPKLKTTRGDAL